VLHLRESNFILDWINPSWRYDNCFDEQHSRVTIAGTTDLTLHCHLDTRTRPWETVIQYVTIPVLWLNPSSHVRDHCCWLCQYQPTGPWTDIRIHKTIQLLLWLGG